MSLLPCWIFCDYFPQKVEAFNSVITDFSLFLDVWPYIEKWSFFMAIVFFLVFVLATFPLSQFQVQGVGFGSEVQVYSAPGSYPGRNSQEAHNRTDRAPGDNGRKYRCRCIGTTILSLWCHLYSSGKFWGLHVNWESTAFLPPSIAFSLTLSSLPFPVFRWGRHFSLASQSALGDCLGWHWVLSIIFLWVNVFAWSLSQTSLSLDQWFQINYPISTGCKVMYGPVTNRYYLLLVSVILQTLFTLGWFHYWASE